MTEAKAKEIFEKYNSKSDVVRCPNGRAGIRKLLDSYAKASVNLYGIISRKEFVEIFNSQNVDKTTEEEVYVLLLPLVLKNGWYCFYKEYIVHYWAIRDFSQADNLLGLQAGKPRYIPEKDEFLKYENDGYEDNEYWYNVRKFMWDAFGYYNSTSEGFAEIKEYITYGTGMSKLNSIFERHNLMFLSEEQLIEFINLTMLAKNNTRIWDNNGYTPSELHEITMERDKNIINFPTPQKVQVGRNDPCPCGSGKKYKKCCALIDDAKTSQLSAVECRDFYETWFGLLGFVNQRKHVISAKIKPEYPNALSDFLLHKVREVLWKNPELIDAYISETKLPHERIEILQLWRKNHKKGMFFVLEYQPEFAVAIAPNENGEDRLYGIKGISNSVANALRRDLPVQIETVLLPFKGKIVYDSYMSSMPVSYAEGAKAAFRGMYDKAMKHGIVTTLE
jgi:hypothetical protein